MTVGEGGGGGGEAYNKMDTRVKKPLVPSLLGMGHVTLT